MPRRWSVVLAVCLTVAAPAPAAAAAPDRAQTDAAIRRGTPTTGGRAVRTTTAAIMRSRPPVSQFRSRPRLRFPVAAWRRAASRPRMAVPGAKPPSITQAQTVDEDVNFLGAQFVNDSTDVPPDSMGAVGPTQFLLGINGRVRSFNKLGEPDGAVNTTLNNFFATLGGNTTRIADPRVRYDRFTARWFISAISVPPTGVRNKIVLAVSDGPTITPATGWSFFQIVAAPGEFLDYDSLGIDEDALYIGTNAFDATTQEPLDTVAMVIRKSSVLGGGPIVSTKFYLLTDAGGPFAPVGVDNFDRNTNIGYFIGVDAFEGGKLDLLRVTNPAGTPGLSSTIFIPTAPTTLPIPVQQPPPGPSLDALDLPRLMNAVVRNGRLWTTHHLEVNSAGAAQEFGGRNGVRWYELINLNTTPTVRQSGTIFDDAELTPMSYWMPSVMVSGQGHAAFGFSRAGENPAGGFASAATTGRLVSDALGTVADPQVYQQSAFLYEGPDSFAPKRWGDYSYTSLDPADDMSMWTVQEYTSAPDRWGVRVARLLAPAPTISSVASVAVGAVRAPVLVTGTGFFEPGTGFAKHLTASATGNVAVNSVVSVTPTQVLLTVTTTGASPGTETLTITNPDGQSVSRDFTVTPPATCVTCRDFNGDAKADVLWHNTRTGQLSVWLMDRTSFASATAFAGKSSATLDWRPAGVADFNTDGKSDLLWHNRRTGAISAWLMDRTRFVSGVNFVGKSAASLDWVPVATSDFNNDSKPDILWHNSRTGQISAWLMDRLTFVAGVSFAGKSSAPLDWRPKASADFNNNGSRDILWHNTRTGQISAWLLNGTQFVSGASFGGRSSASTSWRPVVAADFSGDARPDIMWHAPGNGQLTLWLLNGLQFVTGGAFSGKSSATVDWTPVP